MINTCLSKDLAIRKNYFACCSDRKGTSLAEGRPATSDSKVGCCCIVCAGNCGAGNCGIHTVGWARPFISESIVSILDFGELSKDSSGYLSFFSSYDSTNGGEEEKSTWG